MNRLAQIFALTSLVVVLLPALTVWGQALPTDDEARQLQLEALKVIGLVLLNPESSEADRVNAITVLVRNGDRTAMPLLTQTLLNDPFASVRRIVAEGLGEYQAPESKFALRQAALTAPIDSIRWASGVSLVQIDPDEADILDILLSERDTLASAALSLQEASAMAEFPQAFHELAIAAFTDAFPDDRTYNTVERAAMLKSLAQLDSQASANLMLDALTNEEEDGFVKGAAAFSLGQLGVLRAVPELIAVLNSNDDPLQVGAIGALGLLTDRDALRPLSDLALQEDTAEIRASAATALGAFGASALDVLVQVLNSDPSPAVRQAAMDSLTKVGGEQAQQAVVDFATGDFLITCDPQECSGLALALLVALAAFGEGDLAIDLLQASIDALVDVLPFVFAFAEADLINAAIAVAQVAPEVIGILLDHENPFVQAIALGALPALDDPSARRIFLDFVDPDENRLLRRMAFEGLAQIPQAGDAELFAAELQNRDRRTRGAAFAALTQIGDTNAVAPLMSALASDNLAIQLQAVEASINFGNRVLGTN